LTTPARSIVFIVLGSLSTDRSICKLRPSGPDAVRGEFQLPLRVNDWRVRS